jgi:pilus assembly protein Flp/PilA
MAPTFAAGPRTPATLLPGKEVIPQMQYLNALISSFFSRDEEEGQGLAEYALILALIAIVAIVALIFLGGQVSKILSGVGASV